MDKKGQKTLAKNFYALNAQNLNILLKFSDNQHGT